MKQSRKGGVEPLGKHSGGTGGNPRRKPQKAVQRLSGAYSVPFGRKAAEFPTELTIKFRPSQAEGGWWASTTAGNLSAGARGPDRQTALLHLAMTLATSRHFKKEARAARINEKPNKE